MKLTRKAILICTMLSVGYSARAQDEKPQNLPDSRPVMAFAPPIVPFVNAAHGEDAQANPEQIMSQVLQRVSNDAIRKKWPFKIAPPETIPSVFETVTGSAHKAEDDIRFSDLRPLADKTACRYISVFKVTALTSRYYMAPNFLGPGEGRVTARATIELRVYDRDVDKYVYKTSAWCETNHPYKFSRDVGLRREQDGAMNGALTKALEAFAKGDRVEVEIPKLNIVVTVSKVLANGKVLLSEGKDKNISPGMTFSSIESDARIKIVEVLENGSIAEVTAGSPKDKEVFKPE